MTAVPFNDLQRRMPALTDELRAASERVISSGRYILGPEVEKFEGEFAAFCGTAHAIGVASGTDALEVGLRAAGVAAGTAVVTVANAGGYATTAIRAIGARPVFVDVEPATQLVDLGRLEELVASQAVAAVVVTHLFGRMVAMPVVAAICAPRRIAVVEDCAQAHGARLDGRVAGSHGTIGCFSFYPTKNLGALGDGGAVVTNDAVLAGRARSLRQYGWEGKYRVAVTGGRNSRLDELQAAFLSTKLLHLDGWNRRRRAIADHYRAAIANTDVQPPPPGGDEYVAHLFVVRCRDRDRLQARLASAQIGCDIHYPVPDHLQAGWRTDAAARSLPVTERLASEVLSLPCHPDLRDDEIDAVVRAVNGG